MSFQGEVISSLTAMDTKNEKLLDQVLKAAGALDSETANDVNFGGLSPTDYFNGDDNSMSVTEQEIANNAGYLVYQGEAASLQGTGGVAMLEYAKDAIQTAVSNISGLGTNLITAHKNVERKMGNLG